MKTYQQRKSELRSHAMVWQYDIANTEMSWAFIADVTSRLEKDAKRYGLVREFKENGII